VNSTAVIAAIVTAGASLLVALFSAVAGFRVQRRLQRAGQDHAVDIETLKDEWGRRISSSWASR
jgi:hypothetical protein